LFFLCRVSERYVAALIEEPEVIINLSKIFGRSEESELEQEKPGREIVDHYR
jgi:hypothetical protein